MAKECGRINTPSYHQVIMPIYSHAKGRWQRYELQFEPFMPTMQRWIEHWGYEQH